MQSLRTGPAGVLEVHVYRLCRLQCKSQSDANSLPKCCFVRFRLFRNDLCASALSNIILKRHLARIPLTIHSLPLRRKHDLRFDRVDCCRSRGGLGQVAKDTRLHFAGVAEHEGDLLQHLFDRAGWLGGDGGGLRVAGVLGDLAHVIGFLAGVWETIIPNAPVVPVVRISQRNADSTGKKGENDLYIAKWPSCSFDWYLQKVRLDEICTIRASFTPPRASPSTPVFRVRVSICRDDRPEFQFARL